MESNACQKKYGKISLVQPLSNSSYRLIMMDYFILQFIFVSIEDIVVIEDGLNIFIGNIV